MMHGKGTLFFENGGKYEATWDNGIATEVFKFYFLVLSQQYRFLYCSVTVSI